MKAVIFAGGLGVLVSMLLTPLLIRYLTKKQFGQFIRQDGPASHHTKRGTPTMGGIVIIFAVLVAWLGGNLFVGRAPSVSSMLAVFLMVGLGLVGFLDDSIKISKERSLGLKARWKILGQAVVGISFGVLALQFPDADGLTPGSTAITFLRDTYVDLAVWGPTVALILFVIWSNFLITAWSNAVNLTDGLDGLASGAAVIFFGAYVLISTWQINQKCGIADSAVKCYDVRDPWDLAILAAAIAGASLGFLWWNTSPAKIFMGDTGSLALGGAIAGMTILSRTELLGVIVGGLFVLVVASSVLQIGWFKISGGKRLFKMAPLHHHFELMGWGEVTIVTRFWIIAGMFSALGVGLFYAEWVASQ
ncbi:phospho-N-acetylmuramoyl-pentapeptide-transferase [Demequina lignilytica]|uniref:Phospho-N-acetylmuramoyl-pentapeptide-transferase n=1 Tax=Demequina lignilytica TaxID=3051663 RepID=A0AAW7M7W7_9MICO|nr:MULTISPECIES: phospho-N-acetylmuramoyl-pentapeptide-transferase [unclassified Demequina]MDN4477117.1 phospho-N-acetylmuramoyl-pentapeptide-transferase [Demequina sp. SYSU T00039-1]MDN4483965.1 phospho-N-acetylmuramoyl-pentapeptide-transferase [Demequina sp. SYSU T0a273]MDN4487290.1 phospho-N-acetylmuramoyl-pentapeptide-transferase [Demequina sp. SYSU T00039]MDN4491541.1 phospho-N-acetylmuramoyl-pentapeptide-transferase [Demequina sp. SYSU T00068]